jgi:hypothetical protein
MLKNKKIPPDNNIRREATKGEVLNQWLFKGVGNVFLAPFLVLKRVSNPFKNRREAPSGSCYPMVSKNHSREKSYFEIRIFIRNKAKTALRLSLLDSYFKRVVPFFTVRWYHFKPVPKLK